MNPIIFNQSEVYMNIMTNESINYTAICLLERLGINLPTEEQILACRHALSGRPLCGSFASENLKGYFTTNTLASRILRRHKALTN